MRNHAEGKLTLRSYKVDVAPLPKVDSKPLRGTRKKLRRFAGSIRAQPAAQQQNSGKIGAGQGKTQSQAAALVLVVRTYPDTRARLDEVTRK